MITREPTPRPAGVMSLTEASLELNAGARAVLDQKLAPFIGPDSYLPTRLTQENRIFRQTPGLKDQVTNALLSDTSGADEVIAVLNAIDHAWQTLSPKETPITRTLSTITGFRSLISSVHFATEHIEPSRKEELRNREHILVNFALRRRVQAVPLDELGETEYVAEALAEQVQELAETLEAQSKHGEKRKEIKEFERDASNFKYFTALLTHRHRANEYVKLLPGDDPEPVPMEQIQQDTAAISALFGEIHANRPKKLKTSYFPDERGGSLILNPAGDTKDHIPFLAANSDAVAMVVHSRSMQPRKLIPKHNTTYIETGEISEEDITELDGIIDVYLHSDGQLYTSGTNETPLLALAIGNNKYQAYRDLQRTVIEHYIDLTYPTEEATALKHILNGSEPTVEEPAPSTASHETVFNIPQLPTLNFSPFPEGTRIREVYDEFYSERSTDLTERKKALLDEKRFLVLFNLEQFAIETFGAKNYQIERGEPRSNRTYRSEDGKNIFSDEFFVQTILDPRTNMKKVIGLSPIGGNVHAAFVGDQAASEGLDWKQLLSISKSDVAHTPGIKAIKFRETPELDAHQAVEAKIKAYLSMSSEDFNAGIYYDPNTLTYKSKGERRRRTLARSAATAEFYSAR